MQLHQRWRYQTIQIQFSLWQNFSFFAFLRKRWYRSAFGGYWRDKRRYRSWLSSLLLWSFHLGLIPLGGSLICTLMRLCWWPFLPCRQTVLLLNSWRWNRRLPQLQAVVDHVKGSLMVHRLLRESCWQHEAAFPCRPIAWLSCRSH